MRWLQNQPASKIGGADKVVKNFVGLLNELKNRVTKGEGGTAAKLNLNIYSKLIQILFQSHNQLIDLEI